MIRTSHRAPKAPLRAAALLLALMTAGGSVLGEPSTRALQEGPVEEVPVEKGPAEEAAAPADDRLAALVEDLASDIEGPAALRPAYEFFIESMEGYDGDSALQIARAMHKRSFAMFEAGQVATTVWSAFCLEGALRRGAKVSREGVADAGRFQEASQALRVLIEHPSTSRADQVALVQRYAIVAAGFGSRGVERAALGAALARGGVDGAQITGLARLVAARQNRSKDWVTPEVLFASLLDRMAPGSLDGAPQDSSQTPRPLEINPSAAPWALRGHGLSVLGALRAKSELPSSSDSRSGTSNSLGR